MSALDLTAITAKHALNPHDFGCSCGRWTYRIGGTNYGIDIPGHLIHVAEVVEAAVREDARGHDPEAIEDRIDRENTEHEDFDDGESHPCPMCDRETEDTDADVICAACERTEADWDRL